MLKHNSSLVRCTRTSTHLGMKKQTQLYLPIMLKQQGGIRKPQSKDMLVPNTISA